MNKNQMNLQDSFLNQVRKENCEIRILLLDGSAMSGLVRGFDNFTIIVHSEGKQYLVYKHAIAQIEGGPIRRRREEHEGHEEGAAPQRAPESRPAENRAPETRSAEPARQRPVPAGGGGASGDPRFNSLELPKLDVQNEKA